MIVNKKIAIVGFGLEGVSSANYLGSDNQIYILEKKRPEEIPKEYFEKLKIKNTKFYFNGNIPRKIVFDYIVRSPGVKPDSPQIKKIIRPQTILTSATQIFFDKCPSQIIGVTGTKGKGTTASLIFKILKNTKKDVFLAGNIGTCPLDILPFLSKKSIVILELSSFQLLDLQKSPHVAVILMVTSEHLNWHQDQLEYLLAKRSITAHQTADDFTIVNKDFKNSVNLTKNSKAKIYYFSTVRKTNGTYIDKGIIHSQIGQTDRICRISEVLLPGKHNLQNVLAAVAVAKIYKVESEKIVKFIKTFRGLRYRLEYIGQYKGVKFYNDSYSTIPDTTIAAIEAFPERKILILGGSSKNSNFVKLAQKIISDPKVKAIIIVGQESERIIKAISLAGKFKGKILEGPKNMEEIVSFAMSCAVKNDVIILSPACASFDMFKDYKDRGMQFTKEVKKLGAL